MPQIIALITKAILTEEMKEYICSFYKDINKNNSYLNDANARF